MSFLVLLRMCACVAWVCMLCMCVLWMCLSMYILCVRVYVCEACIVCMCTA